MRSIGIDAVDIKRFIHWHKYTPAQLSKIYTEHEIIYCSAPVNNQVKAQRFAVRYAAKEATYKALCSAGLISCSFLSFAHMCELVPSANKAPHINLKLTQNIGAIQLHCSLTHTETTAVAVVILI